MKVIKLISQLRQEYILRPNAKAYDIINILSQKNIAIRNIKIYRQIGNKEEELDPLSPLEDGDVIIAKYSLTDDAVEDSENFEWDECDREIENISPLQIFT